MTDSSSYSTGYGPRARLLFDGDEEKYELWEVKFLGHLRIHKLHNVLTQDVPDADKNARVYAELVQLLDDTSLSLVIREAADDGKKALQILREHYLGTSKPRIISLYTELTTLKKAEDESVTEYLIRAEKAATSLKNAKEIISDSLLVAMVLKGLPPSFKTFSTVVTQREKEWTFMDFKVQLRSFEESEKSQQARKKNEDGEHSVMNAKANVNNIKCFSCGKAGHKSFQCSFKKKEDEKKGHRKPNRWCEYCKTHTHDTYYCRRKNSVKVVSNTNTEKENQTETHNFMFKASCNRPSLLDPASSDGLLVDCGATTHIITDKSKFHKFDDDFEPSNHSIELADGSRTSGIVSGKGTANIELCDTEGTVHKVELKNALYIPTYQQDIFSVKAATERGATVVFTPDHAELKAPNGTKFNIQTDQKLYFLNSVSLKSGVHSLEEWHRILGHCNVKDVMKLEGIVDGMKFSDKNTFNCETCTLGKMTQYRNRESDKRADRKLELVHCDLAGPIDPPAREGFKYSISFVDDYSGVIMVYLLKHKNDTVKAAERFLADCAPYGSVKRLRTDNGSEFTSTEFRSLLVRNRIKQEFSSPYSPHQNGTVERSWRTIYEMARCLLLEANLPKKLWTYAVKTAAYIRNRCYNPRTGKTPFEIMTGEKPNLKNMHIFGTVCYAYVQQKKKLDARSERGIFLGYDTQSPAYLVYFAEQDDVKRVRCVKFSESMEGDISKRELNPVEDYEVPRCDESEQDKETVVEEGDKELEVRESDAVKERRYQRLRSRPKYLEDYLTNEEELSSIAKCSIDYCYHVADVPSTYEEALLSSESHQWQTAMQEEIDSLYENDTFELVQLPEDRNIVGGKWVYAVKQGLDDTERFKARYVAKGYSQVKDIDYDETFSPTARHTSIRMLMQLVAQEKLQVHQMDVKTAYLNADIDCEIYLEQPKGFVRTNENGDELVCKLKKSLYGLKQSGRNWNHVLHKFLIDQNFKQSVADPCLYTKLEKDVMSMILIWVDDLIICSSNDDVLNTIKKSLKDQFQMKDMGQLSWFLGIEFTFDSEGNVKMSQRKYCERILERFHMMECNPKSVPCDMSVNKLVSSDSTELADPKLYRMIVGSLIYITTGTRPDLSYIVSKLSQSMSKPTKAYLGIAKHVLKYIKGTLHYCLEFKKSDMPLKLTGYCDSDWGASEDRKSTTGYCFQLNNHGPLISWKSKKQRVVALSTCEAEYMAMTRAMQEANFLRQLYSDMTGCDRDTVLLHVDNKGAIELARNPVHHQRSKHIDIKYHFIRSEVEIRIVDLLYVPSDNNVADIFTKPVSKKRLNNFDVVRGGT